MAEERKVSDLSDEEKNALIGEVAGDIDGRKRAAKGKLAADYLLKNVLARTLDYYIGRDPGPTVKQQRLAQEAARREGYEEDLKQDTFQNRTAYSERLQKYMDDLANRASGSLTAENEANLEQAKQTVSLANSTLKGISKPKTQQEASANARKAAYSYLKLQSQGRGGPEALESLMASKLDSIYEIDEFARYIQEGMRIAPGTPGDATFTEDVQTDPEGAMGTRYPLTEQHVSELQQLGFAADMPEQVRGASAWGTYKANRLQAGDLPVEYNGLNRQDLEKYQQWYNLQEQALKRIEELEGSTGMQGQLLRIAKQGLTAEQLRKLPPGATVADVFTVQTGMSLDDAVAADAILEDEVTQALDYMRMTNDFDPLLSNQNYIAAMDRKGMNANQFASYLKERRRDSIRDREISKLKGASDPTVAKALAEERAASVQARQKMYDTKAKEPTPQATAAAPTTPGSDPSVNPADDQADATAAVQQRTADAAGQRGGAAPQRTGSTQEQLTDIAKDLDATRRAEKVLRLTKKRLRKERRETKRSTKDVSEDTLDSIGRGLSDGE